jgi:ABC-type sugar transport system ATPase subunit
MTTDPSVLIALRGITKSFGGAKALRGVDLGVSAGGVVHSLLGSNGSGKSTLLGILSGQLRPDAGTIYLEGEEVSFSSPVDAVRRGIAMVSQENHVASHLSVAENILLGRRLVRTRFGINWSASRRKAIEALHLLDVDYDPDAPVGTLRADQRQMVEIARAVAMDARVLILDEPTSSLNDNEVRALFSVIKRLTGEGVSVIFVSHRLPEVSAISDEMTILRNGQTVERGLAHEFTTDRIISAIVGSERAAVARLPKQRSTSRPDDKTTLVVQKLTIDRTLTDVSLSVRVGETVGLAGLEGSGREELLDAIFGVLPTHAGVSIRIDQQEIKHGNPRSAIDHGIGYVPPDRKSQGVVLPMSVAANLRMAATRSLPRLGRTTDPTDNGRLDEISARLNIRATSLEMPVGQLSGGNQQKVVLAKWLLADPRVLLLAEPTRGVDIGAKAEIHELLRQLASDGLAILVSSSENDELLAICDRILVMFNGRIVASLDAEHATEGQIARLASGHSNDSDPAGDPHPIDGEME